MALDKQKILNDLGNIVNQLQSADCGCLGKVFYNSGPANYNPTPCYGYSNNGYNTHCAGDAPCCAARPCTGYCNPPRLYADTYNYLNSNLMQPVVQEVYSDLKSITPYNTVFNNPMGAQLMSDNNNNQMQGNMSSNLMQQNMPMGNQNMNMGPQPHIHFGNPPNPGIGQMGQGMGQVGQGMGQAGQGMGQMEHGMGRMGHDAGMHQMGHEQGMHQMGHEPGMGQMGRGMDQMGQGMAQMGQGMGQGIEQGMAQGMSQGVNQGMGQHGMGQQGMGQQGMGHQGMGQVMGQMGHSGGTMGNIGEQIVNMMTSSNRRPNFTNQGGPQANSPGGNMMQNPGMGQVPGDQGQYNSGQMQGNPGYMQQNNMQQGNPGMQQAQFNMSQPNAFPGAGGNVQSNGMSGGNAHRNFGLRQMGNMNGQPTNPYGKHAPGINKFNEMFPGLMNGDLGFDPMAIAIQMNPANQQRAAMNTMEKMMMNNSKGLDKVMESPNMQQVMNSTNAAAAHMNQINQPPPNEMPPQQMQEPVQQQQFQNQDQVPQRLHQQQQQQEQIIDPNTGAVINSPQLPTLYEGTGDSYDRQQAPPTHASGAAPEAYRDPIFPADTSKNLLYSHHFHAKPIMQKLPKQYDYNTLGQLVEKHYQNDLSKYANVKGTVSKTALVGNKAIGRTPSRTQQQAIYNQYKGSHSYTQQNIKPNEHFTYSQPRINVPQTPSQGPIERVGGDTVTNNQFVPVSAKLEFGMDPAAPHKYPNISSKKAAEKGVKLRNGLQDQTFACFPTSAKWSFHGSNPATYAVGYNYRK